ncbi:MAG: deaminase, partial [Rhodoferax sp.]|nr:deaminase [Rhodoferax sp.]
MDKWDVRFCELAKFVSEWSKDPSAKVGAVVFSKRGGDVSIGYNGFPMGVEDSAERLEDQEMKLELVVHAEQNALIAAGSRSAGSTLYVWGKPICARCAGSIIQAGAWFRELTSTIQRFPHLNQQVSHHHQLTLKVSTH